MDLQLQRLLQKNSSPTVPYTPPGPTYPKSRTAHDTVAVMVVVVIVVVAAEAVEVVVIVVVAAEAVEVVVILLITNESAYLRYRYVNFYRMPSFQKIFKRSCPDCPWKYARQI